MLDNLIIGLNYIIKGLAVTINFLISLLPHSPFVFISNSAIAKFLPTINFFVPVSEIIAVGQAWLTVITLFYLYQIVLRWIKAIE